jgi:predicted ATPase
LPVLLDMSGRACHAFRSQAREKIATREVTVGLVGREAQLRAIDAVLAGLSARGDALLLRGDAGIGKSSILAEAGERARGQGMVVLGATGVQSEAKLPFAGLHQLLRPILGDIERLPSRQHTALQAAFGMIDEAAPDPFLIGLATLDVLSDVASTSPVLVLIDDAQWIDPATSDAIFFVARRIASDPVVVLAATRDGIRSRFDQAGWPEIYIDRLDDASARELIEKEAPDLTPTMRQRVLEEAAGNPLAIVELPSRAAFTRARECWAARRHAGDRAARASLCSTRCQSSGAIAPDAPARCAQRRRFPR